MYTIHHNLIARHTYCGQELLDLVPKIEELNAETEIIQLEQMDESLMRLILECPMSVPKEMLYLEVGLTPIRYILMSRRLMFYQYILKQPEKSLIRRFYETQRSKPVKNDWSLTLKSNLESLKVDL